MSKRGLILEGGAMRGMFTAGVLDVFLENGIEFDGAVGVSAGAVFGCNYKSKQIGRAIRYNKRFMGDKRYCSISSLIKTGDLFNAKFCYETLPYELDIFDFETYKNNPLEFYCVCSDLKTGKPVYKILEECDKAGLTWMRASGSMPLASNPVEIDGYTLLDGGITDSIPLKYFEDLGYDKNVVILTQPRTYKKKPNSLIPLMKIMLRKYPAIVEAMVHRHEMYNAETEYVFAQEAKGLVTVICPDEDLNLSRTEKNPDELQRVYDIGREVGLRYVEQLR